ncbi:MAG: YceH family protein [Verrucomicrobiota bacterium]
MSLNLTSAEIRVLGCLIEKERTTPEQYPLSLNSLRLACNQKTSRHPVVDYDEDEVTMALEGLRDQGLVYFVRQSGARVTKFRHDLADKFSLDARETSVLAVLFLRGPQTVGELRTRTERLYGFPSLEAIEETLRALAETADWPMVREQPRRMGQKETRFEHLWGDVVEQPAEEAEEAVISSPRPSRDAEVSELKEEVAALREQVQALEARFSAFESQFQ